MKRFFGRVRRPSYRSQQVVDVLTRKMVDAKDIDTLLNSYLETFVSVLQVRFAGVAFCDQYHQPYIAGKRNVPAWLDSQTLGSGDIGDYARYGIAAILPLCVADQKIGCLVIGEPAARFAVRNLSCLMFWRVIYRWRF